LFDESGDRVIARDRKNWEVRRVVSAQIIPFQMNSHRQQERKAAKLSRWLLLRMAAAAALLCLLSASLSSNADDKILKKHYGLIFGTAYGPDDRPVYGAKIQIHVEGKKHPSWELVSDHRGEFAQRVPPGPADYVITGEVELVPAAKDSGEKKKKLKAEAKVHIQAEERQDIGLHFKE
jgi:hypothetical protein